MLLSMLEVIQMNNRDYGKLRLKIVAITLGFSLIPLLAMGVAIYYQVKIAFTANTSMRLRTVAESRRNAIDLFLDERVSQLTLLAFTNSFEELSNDKNLDFILTLMQSRSKSFIDIGVIDQDGMHVAYSGSYKLKGINYQNEEWFHEVMLRGIYISDVFTGFRKFPHFIIAVMRRDGNHNWIIRATIDTAMLDSMVKAAQIGRNGDAFIVNKGYLLQTTPRYGGELLGKTDIPSYTRFEGTLIENIALNGNESLIGMTWLRNKEWLLVIKEDPKEEYLPIDRVRRIALGLGFAGVTIIIVGAIVVARSFTDKLIQMEREKAAVDASLLQSSKMAALGKLAAGIGHEVNNPLAVIKEKVGWLKDLLSEEDISGSENFREFADGLFKIDSHVDRARKVTHRLLGFARRMEPAHDKVEINKLLDESIDLLRNEALYRNIQFNTAYGNDIPEIMSDTSQLQQVFLNILNNAIDAIEKDGEITVKTDYSASDRGISVTIEDDGPGIPKEVIGKIFDPFFTTREVGKGTGLGLTISYSIIEKLGGRITVASEEGKGTKFNIYLPPGC